MLGTLRSVIYFVQELVGDVDMRVCFDNRISLMDIVAIIGSLYIAFNVFFTQGTKVAHLAIEAEHLRQQVDRVEVSSKEKDNEIFNLVQRRFNIFDSKLDRLMERQQGFRSKD